MKHWKKITAAIVTASLVATFFHFFPSTPISDFEPEEALGAANVGLRQEINILNRYFSATAGSQATSSELIYIDPTKYSGTVTYYLEIVASTSISLDNDVYLISSGGTTTCTTNIPVLTTSMTLIRGSACTKPTSADTYRLVIGNDALGNTTVKAARVVILQSFADSTVNATSTQTQIEIGSYINASSSTSTNPAGNPKYWTYSSSSWDGTKTFALQVSFQNTTVASSSWLITTTGTTTYTTSPGTVQTVVELWGAGGGGRCTTSTQGGSGGAGGGYVRSTTTVSSGSHTVFVPQGGRCGVTAATTSANFDITTVRAPSGPGSAGNAAIAATATTSSEFIGQIEYNGGTSGAAAGGDDTGGGGGGAAGPLGNGGGGAVGQATVGGGGGGGNNGSTATTQTGAAGGAGGGTGGNGGNAGAGAAGGAATEGGGGGGGSDNAQAGGTGGAPGGGSGGGDSATAHFGGRGQARITEIIGKVNFVLQEDNGSFGSWTNISSTSNQVYSTTTSSSTITNTFSPTDGRHYRLVASSSLASTTYSIFNAKIVVNQTAPTAVTLVDSYSETNADTGYALYGAPADIYGQAFTSTGGTLDSVKFYLNKNGTPPGTFYALLYAATGTVGSNATATGPVLATSTGLTASDLSTSNTLVTFNFTGTNRYQMVNGANYVIAFITGGAGDVDNYVGFQLDDSSPTHAGNTASNDGGGGWFGNSTDDTIFYLYAEQYSGSITKLEPQYLLANTSLNSGTALQNSLTKWDNGEWANASTTFQHQLESAPSSASDGEVDTSGGTLVTGSTVSNPNNLATSTEMTMPANGNLDMKLTTNNNDVYASRILVRVNLAPVGGGGGGGETTVQVQSEFWFE